MILSVSRRTDIPRFYFDWFLNRLEEGEVLVRNPMNHNQVSRIVLNKSTIDCIAFWTKDATPMVGKLEKLQPYPFFIQFTINAYGNDIETNLSPIEKRLESFKSLSLGINADKMIWRYSPILLNEDCSINFHIENFHRIAEELSNYTNHCRISFLDMYNKIIKRMSAQGITTPTEEEQLYIVKEFIKIGKQYNIEISGCGNMDLQKVGLETKACIDKQFVEAAIGRTITKKKDKNQRDTCYCMPSVEIGTYNTCLNGCTYCYANWSNPSIKRQVDQFDINSSMLCSQLTGTEKVNDRKLVRLK